MVWVPVIILLVSLLAGLLLARIVSYPLRCRIKRQDLLPLLGAVERQIFLCILLAGCYFAVLNTPLIPAGMTKYITIVFSVVIVFIAAWCLTKISAILLASPQVPQTMKGISPLVLRILNIFIYISAFILVLHLLGINITALLAGLGIAGVAVAFALQETLSQFFAGFYIMSEHPVSIGDYVELEGGTSGYVVDIGWRAVRIKDLRNNIIIIPNTRFVGSIVRNYHLPSREMVCTVDVGVSYDSDLEKVEKVTIEVAKNTMKRLGIELPGFEPFIRYNKFDEYSIKFTVVLGVREFTDQYLLIHEFIKELHRRYKEEGIVIPIPQRAIYLEKTA